MQHEFEKLVGIPNGQMDPANYADVEMVYAYHPIFDGNDVTAKQTLVQLYALGGLALLREMLPAAQRMHDLEAAVQRARVVLDQVQRLREIALAQYRAGSAV